MEKKLNEKESLELIARMIQNTKQNFEKGDGNIFIIWGVSTLIVTCLVSVLLYFTNNGAVNWLWMLIPIIGYTWMHFLKKNQAVYTHIDKVIRETWLIIGCFAVLTPLLFVASIFFKQELWFPNEMIFRIIPFIEILICSIGLTVTGITLDNKTLRGGGAVGIFLSFLTLLNISWITLFVFVLWSICSMIIPGIKFNTYIRKNKDHV